MYSIFVADILTESAAFAEYVSRYQHVPKASPQTSLIFAIYVRTGT
jgi:hypothetical protein